MPKEELQIDNNLNEIQKITLEKAKELSDFCAKNGNPITFISYGENFDLKKINKIESSSIDVCLEFCKSYLNGPMFTDEYSIFHEKRKKWEDKYEGLMNRDIKNYYDTNRLNRTSFFGVLQSLDILIGKLEESELKNKLEDIKNKFKKDTRNLTDGYYKGYISGYISEYGTLLDEQKIELVNKFKDIVLELIAVLENKT